MVGVHLFETVMRHTRERGIPHCSGWNRGFHAAWFHASFADSIADSMQHELANHDQLFRQASSDGQRASRPCGGARKSVDLLHISGHLELPVSPTHTRGRCLAITAYCDPEPKPVSGTALTHLAPHHHGIQANSFAMEQHPRRAGCVPVHKKYNAFFTTLRRFETRATSCSRETRSAVQVRFTHSITHAAIVFRAFMC